MSSNKPRGGEKSSREFPAQTSGQPRVVHETEVLDQNAAQGMGGFFDNCVRSIGSSIMSFVPECTKDAVKSNPVGEGLLDFFDPDSKETQDKPADTSGITDKPTSSTTAEDSDKPDTPAEVSRKPNNPAEPDKPTETSDKPAEDPVSAEDIAKPEEEP